MTESSDIAGRAASAPNLEYLRKQSKALLKGLQSAEATSLGRLKKHHPHVPALPKLADAQLVVARESGFPSWPSLKAYADSISGANTGRFRAIESDISYFDDRAAGLVSRHASGLPSAAEQIRRTHPRFRGMSLQSILDSDFTLADARIVMAREHGRGDWRSLKRWAGAIAAGETVEPFLQAFAALKQRRMEEFETWLRREPSLANAPGSNGNTLLNLAVSVRNAEAVGLLLRAGADANAGNVNGATPLHQAGYSNQAEVAAVLLAHGADAGRFALGDGGTPLVFALFWGHAAVTDVLIGAGILPENLRAASGAGSVEMVASFFTEAGSLRVEAGAHRMFYRPHSGFPVWHPSGDPQEILDEAFVYAAKSARLEVMDLLLAHGARIDGDPYRGPALHWAAAVGSESAAVWLIEHGATVSLRGTFGGPTHGEGVTPLHLAAQVGNRSMVETLLRAGAERTIRDALHDGQPAGWAAHSGHTEIAELLRT